MTDHDPRLDALLGELPHQMPFPPTPDVAGRIAATLPDRRPLPVRRPSPWLFGAAIAAVLLVLVVAFPGPRNAVADFLGLPGIRIELTEGPSSDEPTASIGSSLLFGDQTTLDNAQEHVPFPILLPASETMREPDEVWVRTSGDVPVVSLIYAVRDDLPEIGETNVGMLLMQFQASEEAPLLAKRSSQFSPPEIVYVNGEGGFWIENGVLVVLPSEITGEQEMTRRSGNVLIWEDEGVTYRMETALDMSESLRIAESLQPFEEARNQTPPAVVGEVATLRTSSRRNRHEPSPLPCRHSCHTARSPRRNRPRRRLGVDPPLGADPGRLRR